MDTTPMELLSLMMVTGDWIEISDRTEDPEPNKINWDDWIEPTIAAAVCGKQLVSAK